jgi:fructose-1,6-bisphosphatase/inositol monophosphatase family enzyme
MPDTDQESELFESRRKKWALGFGEYAAFVLAAVRGAQEKIADLGQTGTQVVAVRNGEYRSWDTETLAVDQVAESYYIERIRQAYKSTAVILSEEVERVAAQGRPLYYIVSDPFDGSLLFKHRIPFFWYTALAIYAADGTPLAAAVCDVRNASVEFSNGTHAFTGAFSGEELIQLAPLHPARTTALRDAFLETYLMKIPRLYPACEIWKPLFSQIRSIIPNGGPSGFSNVASGSVDIYFAPEEAHTENFSSLPIAWAAGAIVTDFDGQVVRFEDNIRKRFFILCTANERLHEQVLKEIRKLDWKNHPHYAQILATNDQCHPMSSIQGD